MFSSSDHSIETTQDQEITDVFTLLTMSETSEKSDEEFERMDIDHAAHLLSTKTEFEDDHVIVPITDQQELTTPFHLCISTSPISYKLNTTDGLQSFLDAEDDEQSPFVTSFDFDLPIKLETVAQTDSLGVFASSKMTIEEYGNRSFIFSPQEETRTWTTYVDAYSSLTPNLGVRLLDSNKYAFYLLRDIEENEMLVTPRVVNVKKALYFNSYYNWKTPDDIYYDHQHEYVPIELTLSSDFRKGLELKSEKIIATQLFHAVLDNNSEEVVNILQTHAHPFLPSFEIEKHDDGYWMKEAKYQAYLTPLMLACFLGNKEIIQLLINDPRCDIHHYTLQTGNTAIFYLINGFATEKEKIAIVDLFLLKDEKLGKHLIRQVEQQLEEKSSTKQSKLRKVLIALRKEENTQEIPHISLRETTKKRKCRNEEEQNQDALPSKKKRRIEDKIKEYVSAYTGLVSKKHLSQSEFKKKIADKQFIKKSQYDEGIYIFAYNKKVVNCSDETRSDFVNMLQFYSHLAAGEILFVHSSHFKDAQGHQITLSHETLQQGLKNGTYKLASDLHCEKPEEPVDSKPASMRSFSSLPVGTLFSSQRNESDSRRKLHSYSKRP